MKWEMGCDECDVMEKRLVGMFFRMFLKAGNRVICICGRGVIISFVAVDFDRLVVDRIPFCGEEVSLVSHVQRAIKSSGEYLAIDVPFAAVVIPIPKRFQEVW